MWLLRCSNAVTTVILVVVRAVLLLRCAGWVLEDV